MHGQTENQFDELIEQPTWKLTFQDSGADDWREHWFLDGVRATVKNTEKGMAFSAGPIFKDNGSHAVLWTKQVFEGALRIEFDYTRLDDIYRAVNIIYIQATGKGQGPYTEDITDWSHLRTIPYMSNYFQNMNLLHVSYAAYGADGEEGQDYVRARRYPVPSGGSFGPDTKFDPDYFNTGLFTPGVTYHFTVIKSANNLYMQVREIGGDLVKLFSWDISTKPPVTQGRIGFRHMYTRAARYANIKIYQMDP